MITARRTRWVLLMAFMAIAFCLAQHSYSRASFTPASVVKAADHEAPKAKGSSASCELSGKSLHASEPSLILPQPFLIMVLAIIAAVCRCVTSPRQAALNFPPPPRRHLTFCVFRE